jgi:hypothetical protein
LDHGKAKKLADRMDDNLRVAYENLINILKNEVLSFQQANYVEYTDHSLEHCRRMTEHLAVMIPDHILNDLFPLDIFILLCSAWLHDIGMLWKRIGKGQEPRDDSEIRRRHHELTQKWVKENWGILIPGLHPGIAERIADVCFCHRKRVNIEEVFPQEFVYIGTDKVRVWLLSALLRLADAMDTDVRRAPELILDIYGLKEESEREWQKCRLIEGIGYDLKEKDAIIVTSRGISNERSKDLFLEKCKDLYTEFYSVREILLRYRIRYSSMILQMPPPEKEQSASELFSVPIPAWEVLQKAANKASQRIIGGMTAMGKYDEPIYVAREEVEAHFRDFVASDKTGFALVGPSGTGKTNLFCHLAEEYMKENVVLLYNGAFLPSSDIERQILKDLEGYCLKQAGGIALEKNRYLIILVDGVNDYRDPGSLLRSINDMVGRMDNPRFKIALTCRNVAWNILFDYERVALYKSKFFAPEGEWETLLPLFTEAELARVYPSYKKRFELLSDLEDLSAETKQMLRDPLMLKLICETYRKRAIPPRTTIHEVFDHFYRTKVFDEGKRRCTC